METEPLSRVAIACQGGGSHTAFTAGALIRLLRTPLEGCEIVALSGTSGGAICALLAWYGFLQGNSKKGAELLRAFWQDNTARTPWELLANQWLVWSGRMRSYLPFPEISPYAYPNWAQEQLRRLLEKHVAFGELPTMIQPTSPTLIVGAVDILDGTFVTFQDAAEITVDAILASTAIPTLFRAVPLEGKLYWDGLFSQNPPVRSLTDSAPDEIWIIQINPSRRATEPRSLEDIQDRRNELAGNLSLEQEVHFIEKINELLASKQLDGSRYKRIQIHRLRLQRDLDLPSKLDRRPEFIADLMAHGQREAEKFLQSRTSSQQEK